MKTKTHSSGLLLQMERFSDRDGEIFKIYEDNVIAIPELESNNEEADTRLSMSVKTSQRFWS